MENEVALRYFKAGWHPLELPAHAKAPPPDGRTGYDGTDLTEAEVIAGSWDGNIGLRMPIDVVGLDVDAYRGGNDTLLELLRRLGDLPESFISHNGRGDGSGIRFFRVPAGLTWVTTLAGIDIIQRTHRYAVVWPSFHPDGRQYEWLDAHDHFDPKMDKPPEVDDLAELPWPWTQELSRASAGETGALHSTAADRKDVLVFLDLHTEADNAGYISGSIVKHFEERVQSGFSRHDTMQHCLTWAMEHVAAGVASGRVALDALGAAWIVTHPTDTRRAELQSLARTTEFDAMVRHAIGKALTKTDSELHKLHDDAAGIRINVSVDSQLSTEPEPESQPTLPQIDWAAFVNRDETDDHRQWLIEGFWPWGRAMALWAAAKSGKSELTLWCATKLALGEHPWTGQPVDPVDVLYIDLEMTEDDLEERLEEFRIDPLRLPRLHYLLHPPMWALNTEQGGQQLAAWVDECGAQAVIIDTFVRSVRGEENESDTVTQFAQHTGTRLKQLGVGYLRTDHAGKDRSKGPRGTSAKRDDVDVVWSLTRSQQTTPHPAGGLTSPVKLDCEGSSRLHWVGPKLNLERTVANEVIRYTTQQGTLGSPAGVLDKVAELDTLGVPWDAGRPTCVQVLRAAGKQVQKRRLDPAIRYRRDRGQPTAPTSEGAATPTEGAAVDVQQ